MLILLVTAAVCYGALLPRSAGGARLTSVFSSGRVAIAGCCAVVGARDMTPGQTVVGAVVVTNDGGAPGYVSLGHRRRRAGQGGSGYGRPGAHPSRRRHPGRRRRAAAGLTAAHWQD